MSIYRSCLAQRGISVPARWWAKVKTVVTEVAIGFALLPLTTDDTWLYTSLIWVAVVLTLVTGAQYFLEGGRRRLVRVEVVAVGTELLLGQIVDTNSAWLGETLAAAGMDRHFSTAVGDNLHRIVQALRVRAGALRRGDRVRRPRPDPGRHHPRSVRRR